MLQNMAQVLLYSSPPLHLHAQLTFNGDQLLSQSSSSLTPTEQCNAQIKREAVAIVNGFHKFNELLFGKSDITAQSDHKPIFKKPVASVPPCLQGMMLSLQCQSFQVEYQESLTSHKQMHDEFVYYTELDSNSPNLTGFQDAISQDIRVASSTGPESSWF